MLCMDTLGHEYIEDLELVMFIFAYTYETCAVYDDKGTELKERLHKIDIKLYFYKYFQHLNHVIGT